MGLPVRKMEEEQERIRPVDSIGRANPRRELVNRDEMELSDYGSDTPLVCAAVALLDGTMRVVENLRSNDRKILPGVWLPLIVGHKRKEDKSYKDAMSRELLEEIGYQMDPNKLIQIGVSGGSIRYKISDKEELRGHLRLYIARVPDFSLLSPDGVEIKELRARRFRDVRSDVYGPRFWRREFFRVVFGKEDYALRRNRFYEGGDLIDGIFGKTKDVLEGRYIGS